MFIKQFQQVNSDKPDIYYVLDIKLYAGFHLAFKIEKTGLFKNKLIHTLNFIDINEPRTEKIHFEQLNLKKYKEQELIDNYNLATKVIKFLLDNYPKIINKFNVVWMINSYIYAIKNKDFNEVLNILHREITQIKNLTEENTETTNKLVQNMCKKFKYNSNKFETKSEIDCVYFYYITHDSDWVLTNLNKTNKTFSFSLVALNKSITGTLNLISDYIDNILNNDYLREIYHVLELSGKLEFKLKEDRDLTPFDIYVVYNSLYDKNSIKDLKFYDEEIKPLVF